MRHWYGVLPNHSVDMAHEFYIIDWFSADGDYTCHVPAGPCYERKVFPKFNDTLKNSVSTACALSNKEYDVIVYQRHPKNPWVFIPAQCICAADTAKYIISESEVAEN